MATTHKTVKADGGGDYTTVSAALAASSSGTAEDYSTITILDSSTYVESVAFKSISYLRLTAAAGCSPTIQHPATPVSVGSSVTAVEIIGVDAAHPITLRLAAGASGNCCLYYTASGYSITLQHVQFYMGGLAGYGMAPGNTTGTTTLYDCTVGGGAFTDFLNATQADVYCYRCDFTGATFNDVWARVNTLGLTMNRCKVTAGTLLTAQGGFGIVPSRKWVITNNVFVGTDGVPFLQLWDGWGTPPNADVWNNTFYKSGAAGSTVAIGVTGVVTSVSVKNNGFYGWGTGVTSADNTLTIHNNGFYGCTSNVGATKVTNTSPQTGDPLLTNPAGGDFRQQVGSAWLDTGTNTGLLDDYAGHTRPLYGGIGTLYDIGAYEIDTDPPDLVSATNSGRTAINAVFDKAVSGAELTDHTKWTVTAPFGGAALTVSAVSCADGIHATLTTSPMVSDTLYRVTCPSTLVDSFGLTIDTTIADFVSPVWSERESGNPWGATLDGGSVDLGAGPYEMVPWAADGPLVTLQDAVFMSLFSDRRAGQDDVLPDTVGDRPYRGGWVFDAYSDSGDLFGSRLWLLYGQPITGVTPRKVEEYALEALQWLVDVGAAARVDAVSERIGMDAVSLVVTVSKKDGTQEVTRFDDLWAAFAAA